MMMLREAYEAMRSLVLPLKPYKRKVLNPMAHKRAYRGKVQHIVGYTWCRPGSHHFSGMTYDCILGWGDSYEAAIDKARDTIKRISNDHR